MATTWDSTIAGVPIHAIALADLGAVLVRREPYRTLNSLNPKL